MTEAEWHASVDTQAMLELLRGKASDRKLRLFACACCRAVWDSFWAERSRQAVEVAEQYADGLARWEDLHRARSGAFDVAAPKTSRGVTAVLPFPSTQPLRRLILAGEAAQTQQPFLIGRLRVLHIDEDLKAVAPGYLRDIFGALPFRTSTISPTIRAWCGGTVLRLAEAAYAERELPSGKLDPHRLAVLSDALEEAGCEATEVIQHLRSPGPHPRGCFALDAVLARK
jgi:hypothetical protein